MTQPALSLQLYTLKDAYAEDADATLAKVAEMGLTNVEAFAFVNNGDQLAELFAKHGLVARTGHAPLASDELKFGDRVMPVPSLDEVFSSAKKIGLEYVIDPFVPVDRWLDKEAVDATAKKLNEVAKVAAEHGLKVGYHNHSQEFVADIDGVSAFEYFANQLDDEVLLEVDLFWAAIGTDDVVGLIKRLGSRVKALHVKDGKITANPFAPGAEWNPGAVVQYSAGQGEIPLLECLEACPSAEYAVIEFDNYDGDMFEGVKGSVDFFNAHGIK
ncbi:sugar phosphate isomerase/epimerase family protein [Aestuariimicrobium ganziense]|uniref:sugar phosphate isomerase/epimerase family protein n=1 Tax=Aestuariimicrobium ganziense TaxID=2773677 RepID=UPI0019457666|nr:sugar phosphate isomerase/epimerase [Aestuariimicrobium ganziense]